MERTDQSCPRHWRCLGQRSQLWWDVPVIDSFELIRDIYRVDPQVYRQNLEELVALLDLSETLKNPPPVP